MGYDAGMTKPLLAMFVLAVVVVGLLVVLLVGRSEVENDGVEKDSLGLIHAPAR